MSRILDGNRENCGRATRAGARPAKIAPAALIGVPADAVPACATDKFSKPCRWRNVRATIVACRPSRDHPRFHSHAGIPATARQKSDPALSYRRPFKVAAFLFRMPPTVDTTTLASSLNVPRACSNAAR